MPTVTCTKLQITGLFGMKLVIIVGVSFSWGRGGGVEVFF